MKKKSVTRPTVPVQLPLPLFKGRSVPGPLVPAEVERQAAVEASARLLDRIEARAKDMTGISSGDREDCLIDVQKKRKRLKRHSWRQ